MLKRTISVILLLVIFIFQAVAQDISDRFVITSDLTTIYTLGNASDDQRIDTDTATAGAFFNNPVTGTRKNGFYTATNLHATMYPTSWMEGYFKIYGVHRPGSFYMPLQMENVNRNDLSPSIDAVFGKVSVFEALELDLPLELFLKAGKYKAQAAQYGIISKYKTEQIMFLMNTKTDFTYEIEAVLKDPINLSFSAAVNYLFNQSVQRYYDEDGAVKHGNAVLNEYAPQFILAARYNNKDKINVELLYGQNVSGIYSGHSFGFSSNFLSDVNETLSIPFGLTFIFHEKNIDLLGHAAIAEPLQWAGANITTMDFRDSLAIAFGTGMRLTEDNLSVDLNFAGTYSLIKHYYRTDLAIVKMSVDTMLTFVDNYFFGGGIIFGSVLNSEWKTRDGVTDDNYAHTFTPTENMGYEVYAGINLGNNSKFVIGFNQNKGISMNNMLESRHEGQMKFKQADTNWAQDQLAEAGGLYCKFFFKF